MVMTLDPKFNFLNPDYLDLILSLQNKHNILICPLQQLTGGRTGALLYLVSISISENNSPRHLILKLDQPKQWGSKPENEAEKHEVALADSPPRFVDQHIPDLAFPPLEKDGSIAILYSIAGYSLHTYRPLSGFKKQNRLEIIYSNLIDNLISDWYGAGMRYESNVNHHSILREWLGYRIVPGQGNIDKFLITECDFNPESPGVVYNGEIYPNPLFYSRMLMHLAKCSSLRCSKELFSWGSEHKQYFGKLFSI